MREQCEQVENIVTKGKIAHHDQFLLLPQCFPKLSAAEASVCGKGLSRMNQIFNHNTSEEKNKKSTQLSNSYMIII